MFRSPTFTTGLQKMNLIDWTPRDGGFYCRFNVAGFPPESLTVTYKGKVLKINGEYEGEDLNIVSTMPFEPANIQTKYVHGFLVVTIYEGAETLCVIEVD